MITIRAALLLGCFAAVPGCRADGGGLGRFEESLTITPASSPALTWGALSTAAFDYDNDGDLDLVVPGGFAYWVAKPAGLSLLRNDGAGRFEDLGQASGLNTPRVYSNVYAFDYDNDGRLDLYATVNESSQYYDGKLSTVPSADGFDVLYHNQGDGTFADVTAAAGIGESGNTWGAAIADVDNDGYLDIYVAEYVDADILETTAEFAQQGPAEKDVLFRNRGDGTFAEESAARGLGAAMASDRLGYTPVFLDYDQDGDQDLLIPQDFGHLVLYLNDGAGHFSDGSAKLHGPGVGTWMGCAPLDIDGDGDFDFACDNGGTSVLSNGVIRDTWPDAPTSTPFQTLLRNDGRGELTDVAAEIGLEQLAPAIVNGAFTSVAEPRGFQRMPWGWGITPGDLDNDGLEDLYQTGSFAVLTLLVVGYADQGAHPGVLLRRTSASSFSDVTESAGIANTDGRGYLLPSWGNQLADLTGDGFLDIVICNHTTQWLTGGIRLFKNPGNDNHWVAFKLRGTKSNRDGVGAEVRLYTRSDAVPQARAITVGGWGGAPLPARFGLARETEIDHVEIRWPSGARQTLSHPAIDQTVNVVEP